ncbi:MAG: glycosyltransferase family 2 protein [Actinomycetaceae bacterium]|nr:glycosyltransferase family 2 protein [Actinomycetaceae bacterium]
MTAQPVITFVVPVYNTERYLDRCVESLLAQTIEDFEIILVNDGATDSSPIICERWRLRDRRIRVITQKNGGLSAARNTGVEHARGNFIGFIDSDDYVKAQFAEVALTNFDDNDDQIDLVALGILDRYPDKESVSTPFRKGCVPYEEFFRLALIGQVPGSVCNRVFRRSALTTVRFRPGRYYEDMFFTGDCVGQIRKACFDLEPLYIYDHRPGSITTGHFSPGALDCIHSAESCVKIAESMSKDVKVAARFRATWSRYNVLDRMLQSDTGNDIRYRELKQAIIRDLRGRTKEVIASPNFSSGRKLAAVALLFSERAYAYATSFKTGVR